MRLRSLPRRAAGATLIEMLVAAGLFMLMGLMIFALFRWGLESFTHGKLRADAQQTARKISEELSREISEAAPPPIIPGRVPSGMEEDPEPPSAVLFPYPRKQMDAVMGQERWSGSSKNEVVFCVAPMGTGDMENYQFVRFRLTGKKWEDGTQNGPLVRSVYPAVSPAGDGTMTYNAAVDPMNTTSPWLLNIDMLGSATEERVVVPKFPNESDAMLFEIRHEGAAGGNMQTRTSDILELKVTVKLYPRGSRKREVKEATETTRVTIKGG